MSEHRPPFRDNPPLEEQVAVLYERIGTFMKNTTDQLGRLENMLNTALHLRSDVDRQGEWQGKHDIHHGEDDRSIGTRLLHEDAPIGARFKDHDSALGHIRRALFDDEGNSLIAPLTKAHNDARTRGGVYLTLWRGFAWFAGIVVAAGGAGWLIGRVS